jgi:hypothetical protein
MRQQHEHMGRTASLDAVRRCGNAAARRRGAAAAWRCAPGTLEEGLLELC